LFLSLKEPELPELAVSSLMSNKPNYYVIRLS